MPRVHIHLHDIDEIEDLEQLENWEELLGLNAAGRHDSRPAVAEQRGSRGAPREIRFGGGEARDRKRSERRKQSVRSGRRYSQQQV